MGQPLRILQIEDSESDAALIEHILEKAGYAIHSERVVNAEGLKAALTQPWDVIIADYRLPEFDAPHALALLQQTGVDVPFIVVSGAIGEDLAVAIMRSGAQDYLVKDHLARLAPAVEREIGDARARRARTLAEQALDRQSELLQQRDTMLREIHHRVKNNMQIMSSLLSLQARTTTNPESARMLEANQNRIQSMALLHEILYQSEDLASLDFSKYLRRMVDHLFRSYGVNSPQIRLHTDLEPAGLELDDALPCGLLISEAVSNSLKHGFPAGRQGEVRITLRRPSASTVEIVVADNGVGLPSGLDWTTSRSLGLRLVRALAEQLHARLNIRSVAGTRVELIFTPKSEDQSRKTAEIRAGGAR